MADAPAAASASNAFILEDIAKLIELMEAGLKKQATIREKEDKNKNGVAESVAEEKLVKPSTAKQLDKAAKPAEEKPRFTKSSLKSADKTSKTEDKTSKIEEKVTNNKTEEKKPTLRTVRTIDDKAKEKSVTIVDRKTDKAEDKVEKPIKNGATKPSNAVNNKTTNDKNITNSTSKDTKPAAKPTPKVEDKVDTKSKMATKPPTPLEKTPSKLPPRKPSLQKQPSKDEIATKKWRDPLHERVKENIDKTLANEIPKGHTLTKNESLRSLLKPTPPPMPPPLPPKMPPPPEFKKAPLDPAKLKKVEQLRSRPRRRPDWSDMMKEVEQGKKLKHVVCNDRSSPIITRSTVVKNKDQFIFESEKPNSHNELLKEINKGVKLKKVKTNDRSKPNLEGLRKFRRQMTIEEQVQKSMSQANIMASPSGAAIPEQGGVLPVAATAEEEEIDEMDDIDKVRDDLQSTKQLLAIELRNKEAQERENKRLLTRIQNLEAELARERAIIKQEQHKTVISVTDAYDERLVNSLKSEIDKTKENADNLEKQYLQAAEDRDTALTELEEVKRRNAELEKKLEQALSNKLEEMYISEEPLSFYQKRQLDFEKQCRLLDIDINSPEAQELKKSSIDANNNVASANFSYTNRDDEGIMPSNMNSRRSSHAIKQLSVTKDDSFEEESESEEEEEESEEKKQKRMEKEVRNMRNRIRHLKEKQDHMKKERMGYKMALKNQQAALKDAKRKYKELKKEVDKMALMMKEVGSDDEDEDEEDEESEDEKKSESEEEETETETEQDTESETESESEPEDAPLPKKKENLSSRLKRHESRVNALKKGNALLMANVDRLKDDVLKQREESQTLQKELDSLIDDLE
ncbi:calponin homology domain-containing protein DDB_G0272472 isoform X2 [Plodia interpunctella]|uniref:calponin homology domain-containing protein DDB_G0272472 isoform X2 n=1 Tax=Plodia interpunctella TaxID=58824 RepID=UPI0023681C08|nr:calponin homology domain-containing protein DDB_G0272472-like isoform X2 [Plodia interpunctella]